jgi:hypothetical protein
MRTYKTIGGYITALRNLAGQYTDSDISNNTEVLKMFGALNAEIWNITSEIEDYLNSESTEGVSDASAKSGDLHAVRESHAHGDNVESSMASDAKPLGKRTHYENFICTNQIEGGTQCNHQCEACDIAECQMK